MTSGRRSPSLIWLALALAAVTVAETTPHRHAVGEIDVQAHDIARVAATADCGTALHLDRAEADRHPACTACLVSSAPGERALARLAIARGSARIAAAEAVDVPLRHAAPAGTIRGRAPPVPPLPID